ncbi:MAG: polyphosphate polymerase domain-containing protein [Akkermansiaceae bacterium]|nr:polyphosphate polymerase domain-containing protein [Akkermansiaceae bacterium]
MFPSRFEQKFLLDDASAARLEGAIAARLDRDRHSGADARYLVESHYFDSPDRQCYWEKQRRLKSRRKIRVRFYGPPDAGFPASAFLEVKHKHFGVGGKRRIPLPVATALRCAAGDLAALTALGDAGGRHARIVLAEVLDLVAQFGHRPVVTIRYQRTALVSDDTHLRVTFDRSLECRPLPAADGDRPPAPLRPILDTPCTIMEVKSVGPVPYWLRDLAGDAALTRSRFSKFCAALEHHDPVLRRQRLPSNPAPQPVLPS